MSFSAVYEPFELSPDELNALVLRYASNPIYFDNQAWENDDNPYRRQLRPQAIKYLDFSKQLRRDQILQNESLSALRMLASIYETDLVFLPKSQLTPEKLADFKRYYNPSNRVLGEMIRPSLEQHVFSFLDEEVEVAEGWTKESLDAYLRPLLNLDRSRSSLSEQAIRNSADPLRAARMWLIQSAPEVLSEASPMARNIMGNYGPVQSEWFKIVCDEYGYGVHHTKHSTLFEQTLTSVGMRTDPHHYWQYYLPSSLLQSNYSHYLGKNHELFFRNLGALYYTETTLVDSCRRAAETLNAVFDGRVDVGYFTEHVHIDAHHGRMALEKLILPMVEAAGDAVIPEIIRGYREYELIGRIVDEDFAAQVSWIDGGPLNKGLHDLVWAAIESGKVNVPITHIVDSPGELSNTHSHDGDELCHIVSGSMKFVSGYGAQLVLGAGEGTVIRKDRLHGAIIESDECVYEVHSLGDYRTCLP